jgi:DNA polymerase III alpha subunit (gram-positive type)
VILIVDGQPDDEEACKKMSEQLVAAGVQFGVVVCGNDNYFDEEEENYYSASVAVKVRDSSEIDTAIPKLMSLIRARGLA